MRSNGETRPHIPHILERVKSEGEDNPATERSRPPTIPLLRRGPNRSSRFSPSYKGMVGLRSTMDTDSALLATMEDKSFKFTFVYAYSQHTHNSYLTEYNNIEDIHTYAFVSKVHMYEKYTPTYKDIRRGAEEEKQL